MIFLVVVPIFSIWYLPVAKADWIDNYLYYTPFTIETANGAGVNYDVQIIVYNSTGINSGNTAYIKNHALSNNFGDIFFVDSSTNASLNFWQQEVTATCAIFWVQIQGNLSSTQQSIRMYYGRACQVSASNITATFPIADDFNSIGANWSWTNEPTSPASYSVSNSLLTLSRIIC
jgi:hypothetical protein